jgi:hypothetical protein
VSFRELNNLNLNGSFSFWIKKAFRDHQKAQSYNYQENLVKMENPYTKPNLFIHPFFQIPFSNKSSNYNRLISPQ